MTIWHQIWSLAFAVGIVGNLTASALWAIPALFHLHRKLDRNHAEHMQAINERFRVDNYHGNNRPSNPADSGDWPSNPPSGKMD